MISPAKHLPIRPRCHSGMVSEKRIKIIFIGKIHHLADFFQSQVVLAEKHLDTSDSLVLNVFQRGDIF